MLRYTIPTRLHGIEAYCTAISVANPCYWEETRSSKRYAQWHLSPSTLETSWTAYTVGSTPTWARIGHYLLEPETQSMMVHNSMEPNLWHVVLRAATEDYHTWRASKLNCLDTPWPHGVQNGDANLRTRGGGLAHVSSHPLHWGLLPCHCL